MDLPHHSLSCLFKDLEALRGANELSCFFEDLCSPAELRLMAERWKVARLVNEGVPYRKIQEQTGVSTATITRVARCINSGSGGYQTLLNRIKERNDESEKRNSNKNSDSEVGATD